MSKCPRWDGVRAVTVAGALALPPTHTKLLEAVVLEVLETRDIEETDKRLGHTFGRQRGVDAEHQPLKELAIDLLGQRITTVQAEPSSVQREKCDFRRRFLSGEAETVFVEFDRRSEIANAQGNHTDTRLHSIGRSRFGGCHRAPQRCAGRSGGLLHLASRWCRREEPCYGAIRSGWDGCGAGGNCPGRNGASPSDRRLATSRPRAADSQRRSSPPLWRGADRNDAGTRPGDTHTAAGHG